MTSSQHRLELGGLVLAGATGADLVAAKAAGIEYRFDVYGEDFTTGDAEPIERTIRTLLQDGAVTVTDGLNNREAVLRVSITAPDSHHLALGEKALMLELGKANELRWSPFDGWGAITVFEVFTSNMGHVPNDVLELVSLKRVYRVRLVCHPTTRAAAPTSVAAIPQPETPPTPTVIDDGTSLTAWSSGSNTLTDEGDHLRSVGSQIHTVRWTGSVDLASTPYVSLDLKLGGPTFAFYLRVDGVDFRQPLATVLLEDGYVRCLWHAAPLAVPNQPLPEPVEQIELRILSQIAAAPMLVRNLTRWDNWQTGTGRQQLRTIDVHGSARTQGSLSISASRSLGAALVYTWPTAGGYVPTFSARRVGGAAPTGDTATITGRRFSVVDQQTFDVPVSDLVRGTHLLTCRLRSDAVGAHSVDWTAQLRVAGHDVGPLMAGTRAFDMGATANTWRNIVLARLALPPINTPVESNAVVRITLVRTPSSPAAGLEMDEGWMFNTSIGALTMVDCGTGTAEPGGPSRILWLDTPSTARPQPAIYRGHSEDRTDAFAASTEVESWGVHEFAPPLVNILIVTPNATDADVSYEYYARFHTHAYDPELV